VQIIPSLDLESGRSRTVYWPGASTGTGSPTDRPERIARHFVELGAPIVHLVDFDGARSGRPANLDAVGRIASEVAVPIQLAGGIDGADQIRLAFAAGATRVVVPLHAVVEAPDVLRQCLEVAGTWLAVGVDPRPDRLRGFPWRSATPPSAGELMSRLAEAGVQRFVLSHGGTRPDLAFLRAAIAATGAEVLVAGGVAEISEIRRLRDAGVAGLILGQALLGGQLDYLEAAAAAA